MNKKLKFCLVLKKYHLVIILRLIVLKYLIMILFLKMYFMVMKYQKNNNEIYMKYCLVKIYRSNMMKLRD